MYNFQSSALANELQRLISQLQQNERNNANTLRSIAGQLQTMSATESQATAMLQQIFTLANQLTYEASRANQFASFPPPSTTPGYETVRSSVNPSTLGANSINASANPTGMVSQQPFGQS